MTSFAKTARNATVGGLALVYTALTFGVATAPAPALASDGVYYRAVMAQPVKTGTKVVRGTAWSCKGNVCVAAKSNSRPAIVCQRLAGKVGDVQEFTIEGETIDQDTLAQCQGKD